MYHRHVFGSKLGVPFYMKRDFISSLVSDIKRNSSQCYTHDATITNTGIITTAGILDCVCILLMVALNEPLEVYQRCVQKIER